MEDINHLIKVMQVVRIKMSEQGITDQFDEFEEGKRRVRKQKEKQNERAEKALAKHSEKSKPASSTAVKSGAAAQGKKNTKKRTRSSD